MPNLYYLGNRFENELSLYSRICLKGFFAIHYHKMQKYFFYIPEPPDPPQRLEVTKVESGSVRLSWSTVRQDNLVVVTNSNSNMKKGEEEEDEDKDEERLPIKNYIIEIAPRNGERL